MILPECSNRLPPRDPRMTANGKVAGLALVALIVFVACSVPSSGTAPGGTATWSGLTYDPDQWQVGADASGESLANLLDPAGSLRFIQGGSELPPGWCLCHSTCHPRKRKPVRRPRKSCSQLSIPKGWSSPQARPPVSPGLFPNSVTS